MTTPLADLPDETLIYRIRTPDGENFSLPIPPDHPDYPEIKLLHRNTVLAVYRAHGLRLREADTITCEILTARTLKFLAARLAAAAVEHGSMDPAVLEA